MKKLPKEAKKEGRKGAVLKVNWYSCKVISEKKAEMSIPNWYLPNKEYFSDKLYWYNEIKEIPKSTEEVKKFSNGNMLLTLWFNGSHCKSMEVVFDMLSGTSILFCTNIKSHYYDAENEVRYGYELPNVASNVKEFQRIK